MTLRASTLLIAAPAFLVIGCADGEPAPTAVEAGAFVAEAEIRLAEVAEEAAHAAWVQANFITEDTEYLAALANERAIGATMDYAVGAARFNDLELSGDVRRKLDLLRLALTMPAPDDPTELKELTQIASSLESQYGSGKYCPEDDECRDLGDLSRVMAKSRDADELLEAWSGWRTVSPPMKDSYTRFVELSNAGARELGFADTGAMWRAKYDMDPDDFTTELDRLWVQVKPLYDDLHCYVRRRLNEAYGDATVPLDGPIPAHLVGNMWAQSWSNIYDLVAPPGDESAFDLTAALEAKGVNAEEMVRYGEAFFTSLGLPPLPETFWQRSLFTQPRDRDVVCHASAWDIDNEDDIRIKMCIEITAEDFSTIHHELGHNFYQRAYSKQPFLYRESANDGFHEGVGDVVALSVTPSYLVEVGLLDEAPDSSADLGVLMRMALDKVAFLPFGLLVDQWRWKVFSGEIAPDAYNEGWWDLRQRYQGVAAPVTRSEADFDPGAKYHVPANTPYTRYFLAHILQFQLHRSLCAAAGYEGPLHSCSIYGNEEAGRRMIELLEMGQSRPWQDALEATTGQREMDATAILDYFAPLGEWLEAQNEGQTCGWS
ncbi:MAG: M2 family metallopeptidase [Acidobacteria bacterium]|nr:M2 family metallopeptidase [Acidobacteriota bacterium]